MHFVYLDESGNTGINLADAAQPIFVLAALIVPEAVWQALERDLEATVELCFPSPRPDNFEIHAKALRNGEGYFRQHTVAHRLEFQKLCLHLAQKHGVRLIYREIEKVRFQRWIDTAFGPGVFINPHFAAFPLVARVVDEYLRGLPGSPLGIFISDENREIIGDVEKAIRLLRGAEGSLKLSQIVEKGFFIDSSKSLVLQLCDMCVYSARKREEMRRRLPVKEIDKPGISLIEPLIHRGNERLLDTIEWLVEQHQKKERPGDKPGSA